jgi:hypothetical protein
MLLHHSDHWQHLPVLYDEGTHFRYRVRQLPQSVVHRAGHQVDAPEVAHHAIQGNVGLYNVAQVRDGEFSGEGVPSEASLFQ